jgi:KDO2-lipid IV(A) lauroyltransferase
MRDYLYLAIYNLFSFVVNRLPSSFLDLTIDLLSKFALFASSKRRSVIYANLDVCFNNMSEKEKKEIALHSYKNLLYNIVTFLKEEEADVRFKGCDYVDKAIKDGKKIIFITAHFGVWELLPSAIIKRFGVGFSIVGRELDSALMQERLRSARESKGVELINKKGALKGMIKALSSGNALGLLVDQSLAKHKGGEDVIFCGKKATQTSAVSILAHKFDALIVPIFIRSKDFKHHIVECLDPILIDKSISKEDDLKRLNQAQADVITSMIKAYPTEWFYSHKRFKVYDKDIYR